jgi:carbon monoxide dehydrogenase subunit G
MKVNGVHLVPAARPQVWRLLLDPLFVREAIPGCQELIEVGDNTFDVVLRVGMGPVRSKFLGQVRIEELQPPEQYRLVTTAQGTAGWLAAVGEVRLLERDQCTEVRYQGSVQVTGMLASLGSWLVESAFRQALHHFFSTIDRQAAAVVRAA